MGNFDFAKVRAEDYDGLLIPTGSSCQDPWVVAASLVPVTSKIKLLVALRTSVSSPTVTARQAASLDEALGGRLLLNVVPGGDATMRKIADLMGVEPQPLDGGDEAAAPVKKVAFIHEDMCIGCTKCIQACPVDAILGATKAMHTVIAAECTGCDLCVDPCPTDCIEMIPVPTTVDNWKWDLAKVAIPVKIVE